MRRQIVHQDDIARLRVGKQVWQHLCGLVFIPVVRVHGPENDGQPQLLRRLQKIGRVKPSRWAKQPCRHAGRLGELSHALGQIFQRLLLCHVLHIIVPVGVKPQLVPVLCHALRKLGVLRNAVAAEKKRRVDVPLRKPVQKLLRDFARGSVVEGQVDPVRFRHRPDQRRKYAANKVRRTDIHSSFCSSRAGKKALRRLPRLPARSGFVRQDTSRHSANPATGEPPEKFPQSKRFRTNCQNVGSAQERPQPSNPRIDRPMRPRRRSTDTTRTRTC